MASAAYLLSPSTSISLFLCWIEVVIGIVIISCMCASGCRSTAHTMCIEFIFFQNIETASTHFKWTQNRRWTIFMCPNTTKKLPSTIRTCFKWHSVLGLAPNFQFSISKAETSSWLNVCHEYETRKWHSSLMRHRKYESIFLCDEFHWPR